MAELRQSINTTLRGFLDLFQLRTGGRNPQVMAEFIQPTIDLQRWYLESIAKTYACTIAPTIGAGANAGNLPITATLPQNLANGVNLVVPQNEMWLLLPGTFLRATMESDPASTRLGLRAFFSTSGITEWIPTWSEGWDTSNATVDRTITVTLPKPYWVQPGMTIVGYQHGTLTPAVTTVDYSATLKLVRLRI